MSSPALEAHHWVFDGVAERAIAPTAAQAARAVPKFLLDLVRVVEMQAIAPPAVVVDEAGGRGGCWRWAGLQLIAESHISVHGGARYIEIDVFSCKPFDLERVGAVLSLWFGDGPLFVSQARGVVDVSPAFVLLRGRLWPVEAPGGEVKALGISEN